MMLSDLAALGSFVSGVAVLISLIFLWFQLRQMNEQGRQNLMAVRAAASQAHSANWQQLIEILIGSTEMARIWREGHDDLEALPEDERVRFLALCSGFFRFYDCARLQWLHGQLDDAHWHSAEHQLRDIIRQPGIQTFWAMRKHWHTPEFRDWIDSLPHDIDPRGIYDVAARREAQKELGP